MVCMCSHTGQQLTHMNSKTLFQAGKSSMTTWWRVMSCQLALHWLSLYNWWIHGQLYRVTKWCSKWSNCDQVEIGSRKSFSLAIKHEGFGLVQAGACDPPHYCSPLSGYCLPSQLSAPGMVRDLLRLFLCPPWALPLFGALQPILLSTSSSCKMSSCSKGGVDTSFSGAVGGIWKGCSECACGKLIGNARDVGGQTCSEVLPRAIDKPRVRFDLFYLWRGIGNHRAVLCSLRFQFYCFHFDVPIYPSFWIGTVSILVPFNKVCVAWLIICWE